MTAPEASTVMATITGPAWHNAGEPEVIGMCGVVSFAPIHLDEAVAPVDSRRDVKALLASDGSLVRRGGLPVLLWAGVWRVTMPDGESWEMGVNAGATYTLAETRGWVAPPGVVAQVLEVPPGDGYLYSTDGVLDLRPGSGGGSGTTDHAALINRDLPRQHPMEAVDGLVDVLGTVGQQMDALAEQDAAHAAAANPHPQYTTPSEAAAAAPVQSVAGRSGDVALTAADITGLAEAAQDAVAAMLASGANIALAYDDAADRLTITASGGDAELMRDTLGAALVGVGGVVVSPNDTADTIAITLQDVPISVVTGLQAALDGKAAAAHSHTAAQIADSTGVGRAVLTASDAAAARAAITAEQTGAAAAALAGHVGAADPHAQYVTAAEAAAAAPVQNDDPRLTDARTPTAHTQSASTISDSTSVGRSVLTAADAAAARTALAAASSSHAATHTSSGDDALDVTALGVGALADGEYLRRSGGQLVGGVPSGGGGSSGVIVDTFLPAGGAGTVTSYTWNKPAGAKWVHFMLVGAGGGGGSGRVGAAGTVRTGGGGGAGGGSMFFTVPADALPASIEVRVGKGGAGGAAVTGPNSDGLPGGTGPSTHLIGAGMQAEVDTGAASGGGGGRQGSAPGGTISWGGGYYDYRPNGASSHGAGGAGSPANIMYGGTTTQGGASGGGITASDVVSAGGGGSTSWHWATARAPAGGTAGGGAGGAGYRLLNGLGYGGAGGGSSITSAGGAGGAGALYGGGGAGGGAALNGFASGAGGAGGDGVAVIVTYL